MTDARERPDPDALLVRIQAAEERATRARLRIFFGFAPGVGKTYRMLEVARALRADGVDVVAGVVETHRRKETMALVEGLEMLPRKRVAHRGHALEEFDLDAALARKPSVLLVDELAHTNAPGSRHPKRWQDVLELLDAGIDVLTTVNVQHVESLNDVIAQITHVVVRETVPDSVFDRADEIEVIDLAPDALLQRLADGNVYMAEQAKRAAMNFFKRGNLLALRELTLRRAAEHVDEEVRAYRTEHGVTESWATNERVLVCVGPSPSSDHLVRAACRIADRLHAKWIAAYVGSIERQADEQRLESHLRLAETLGAQVVRLEGLSVATALLEYARKNHVTRIVVGKPTHPRWRDRLRGSLVDEVVRGSGDIDVQVIGDAAHAGRAAPTRDPLLHEGSDLRPYAHATLLVTLTTGLAFAIRALVDLPDVEVLFILAVMIAATRLGRWPSVLTAALGVASYDFFFVPPFHTFTVADTRYVLTFGMMFGVGILVSELTARLRRQEQGAVLRERRTAALYALSRELGSSNDAEASASIIARHTAELLDARTFVLLRTSEGLAMLASHPANQSLDAKELGVARWACDHGRAAGIGTDTLPGSRTLSMPLVVASNVLGILAVEPRSARGLETEPRKSLDALAQQAASALARIALSEEARVSALRAKTEEMRSALLSAVSHDLRTPLAAITGAATTIRDDRNMMESTKDELIQSICGEAERLERLVVNLLDMTRLDSGSVVLKREWVPLEELVIAAMARLESKLSGRAVDVQISPTLPLLSVDPVLVEQLFLNLLENAAKYTPQGTPIDVTARVEGGDVVMEVGDRGGGFEAGSEESVFERFVTRATMGERRGQRTDGVGLGLAICRAIAEAHEGTISASNRPGGGALFTIRWPLREGAPSHSGVLLEAGEIG